MFKYFDIKKKPTCTERFLNMYPRAFNAKVPEKLINRWLTLFEISLSYLNYRICPFTSFQALLNY